MGGKGSGGNSLPCAPGCECNRHKKGAARYNWSGDNATYGAKHLRVYRALGWAWQRQCVDCGERARDWSQLHGTDGLSLDDYLPRCRKHHRIYDADSYRGERNGQTKLTDEDVLAIRAEYATGTVTQRDIARRYSVSQTHVGQIVRGSRRTIRNL